RPGLGGYMDKPRPAMPVRLVVVENHAAPVADQQVIEPIVIEVADGTAHAVHRACETNLLRHIGERAVAVVAIKFAAQWRSVASARLKGAILDAEQVEPAVVVVVNPGQAAAEDFLDIVFGSGTVKVAKVDAADCSDVLK